MVANPFINNFNYGDDDAHIPFYNNFSKNAIKERITAIMKIRKTTIVSIIISAMLIFGTTVAFATSPTENKEAPKLQKRKNIPVLP